MEAKNLIEKIRQTGRKPEAYSGRFMYGKYCIGCSVERGDRGENLPRNGMVADHLGMDDIVCSELEISDGHLTGFPKGPLCFGSEKVSGKFLQLVLVV